MFEEEESESEAVAIVVVYNVGISVHNIELEYLRFEQAVMADLQHSD